MVTAVPARPRTVLLTLALVLTLAGFAAIPGARRDRAATSLGVRGRAHRSFDDPETGDGAGGTTLSLDGPSTTAPDDTTTTVSPGDRSPAGDPTTTTGVSPTTTIPPGRRSFTGPPVDSVAYQLDAAHSGGHIDPDLPDDLKLLWTRDLHATMSYPLIVGDRVFVVAAPNSDGGAQPPIRLYAFDRRSGADLWPSVEIGGQHFFSPTIFDSTAGLAYDEGRIYVVNFDGVLSAFDPATGDQLWSTALPGVDPASGIASGVTSMPTAKDGRVYVVAPSTVFAVDEADGQIEWTSTIAGGGVKAAPAVSGDGVYVSSGALDVYKLSPADGTRLWHVHAGDTTVIGGATPVLHGDKLYARYGVPTYVGAVGLSFPSEGRVLDAATGALQSTQNAVFTPAFREGVGVFVDDARVATGRDLGTGDVLWSYPDDEAAPLVVNDDVFFQSGDDRLVRVDRRTGEVLFSSAPDLVYAWPNENAPEWMEQGLAEGRGVIAATNFTSLSVFG